MTVVVLQIGIKTCTFQGSSLTPFLCVKNLDDSVTDERLRQEFTLYGTITAAEVAVVEGRSIGFGYVCFSAPEEAARAVTEMNGRIIGSKPISVFPRRKPRVLLPFAQRKEDRNANLATQYTSGPTDTGPKLCPNDDQLVLKEKIRELQEVSELY